MVIGSSVRWCLVVCAAGLAACGSVRGASVDGGGEGSGSGGGGNPDAMACFGTGIVRVCTAAAPSQPLMITAAMTIDTAQASACTPVTGGDGYCVVVATEIVVGAALRATGPKPLVLVASASITVTPAGTIDVGSHRGATPELGAGADHATCAAGTLPTANTISGGGGAGGSFIGPGGKGAAGQSGSVGGIPAAVVTTIAELRGGCPGQPGAPAGSTTVGHGGGAVFLIAGSTIDVQGVINATGEGGDGGAPVVGTTIVGGGGGGAGAGGMIGLDAPAIGSSGTILASGGGGGGGGGSRNNYVGADGVGPTTTIAAMGGDGARNSSGTRVGGIGGRGSSKPSGAEDGVAGTNDQVDAGGGGGGGGGAGLIKAPATASLGTNVSPAPMP